MIIGQFNDSFPPMIDGVANVAINYCRILNEQFGTCYMITPRYAATAEKYPFEVLSFHSYAAPFRNEYRWGVGQMDPVFRKQLDPISFDIVHAHSPFSAGIVARQVARKAGIPLVATLHSKYREDFREIIKSDRLVDGIIVKSIVRFYETADDVWTVNEASIETLREYGYKGEVFVMNNGSDLPITRRNEAVRAAVIKEFHLNENAPLLVYIGQHIKHKNISLMIDALHMLNRQGVNFNMLFIGEGPARREYEERIETLGLSQKVRFAGCISDRDLLKRVYASSEAVLFPSLYDASSLVIKEAASCMCPVLFVEGSTTSQGVIHGCNGFLARNEPGDYAAKIKQIITTEGLSRKVGCGALDTLYVSWDDIVKKVFERYVYLIARSKRKAA